MIMGLFYSYLKVALGIENGGSRDYLLLSLLVLQLRSGYADGDNDRLCLRDRDGMLDVDDMCISNQTERQKGKQCLDKDSEHSFESE